MECGNQGTKVLVLALTLSIDKHIYLSVYLSITTKLNLIQAHILNDSSSRSI